MKILSEVIMTIIFFFTISALIHSCPKEYQSTILLVFVIPFLRILDYVFTDKIWNKKYNKSKNL
jgi:glycerol uptake facilitator-like aquaporin